MFRLTKNQSAFTIVELLVVIVVIGILAAITLVAYNGISSKAINSSVKSDIAQAYKQLEISKTTSSIDTYPVDLNAANLKSSNGTTYTYYSDSPYKSYCLAATNSTTVYSVSSYNPTAIASGCLTNGLVGNWTLDNTTGITDQSGLNNNGTANGGIAIGTATNHLGTANKATSFDGVDDYINRNYPTNIGNADAVTVSLWANLSSLSDSGILSKYDNSGVWSYVIWYQSGLLNFRAGCQNNNWQTTITSTSITQINTWYHIVITYDRINMYIYVNGIQVSSRNENRAMGTVNAYPLIMGSVRYNGISVGGSPPVVGYLNGLMDNVRIYNRALSQTEVINLYNSN